MRFLYKCKNIFTIVLSVFFSIEWNEDYLSLKPGFEISSRFTPKSALKVVLRELKGIEWKYRDERVGIWILLSTSFTPDPSHYRSKVEDDRETQCYVKPMKKGPTSSYDVPFLFIRVKRCNKSNYSIWPPYFPVGFCNATVSSYIRHIAKALLHGFHDNGISYLVWPDDQQTHEMWGLDYGFAKCVGSVDGTMQSCFGPKLLEMQEQRYSGHHMDFSLFSMNRCLWSSNTHRMLIVWRRRQSWYLQWFRSVPLSTAVFFEWQSRDQWHCFSREWETYHISV